MTVQRLFLSFFIFTVCFTPLASAGQNNTSQSSASGSSASVPVNRPQTASQPPASIFDLNADPFDELEKAQQGMNKVFKESLRRVKNYQQAGKSFEPDADFMEQNGQYVLKVDLPGMQKDQINIEAAENSIVISGERKTERQVKDDKQGVYQFERSSGSFYRRLSLPADANTDKITAKYENGVLEVSLPKLKSGMSQPKKVAIQ